jgi:hypothetical protein
MKVKTHHTVPIDRVPAGLVVPPDLEGRFGYDSDRNELWHDGFMSKATFDRLGTLCDDWDYRAALERLFNESLPQKDPASARLHVPIFRRWFGLT